MTENTKKKKKKKKSLASWLVPGIVIAVLLVGAGFMLKIFLSPSGTRKKDKIQNVTLLKPPPPEPPKEKPPEPEVAKEIPKETMSAPTESPQQSQDQPDAPPAGEDLAMETDSTSTGANAFGITGRKPGTGRDVTIGGPGGSGMSRLSLLTKFGWYTSKIQEEVKRQMRKRLDQDGGMPKGKFQVTVKIQLDAKGAITGFKIVKPSGNEKMDEALKTSLPGFRISQPPPEGMPQGMTLRISSQG